MKIAICDGRIPKTELLNLEKYCDRTILLPPFSALAEPVSSHPDMLIFPCPEEKILLTHGAYLQKISGLFAGTGVELVSIEERAGSEYPSDVLLNAAVVGNFLIGKLEHISSSVLDYAKRVGLLTTNINQGYAKCSICTVSQDALISSDPSVLRGAEHCGIDALKISEGHIRLDGYGHGFIGGACGNDGENVFFCGDFYSHPEGEMIADFCHKHGKNAISLSSDMLTDIGTVFFI